jgi:hypothetical protein
MNITHNITQDTTHKRDDDAPFILICALIFIFGSLLLFFIHAHMCGCIEYYYCKKYYNKFCDKFCYYEEEEEIEIEIDYPKKDVTTKQINTFSNRNKYPIFCSICQENQTNTITLNCNHDFCKECIKGYLNTCDSCPLCREEVTTIFEISPKLFIFREEETLL